MSRKGLVGSSGGNGRGGNGYEFVVVPRRTGKLLPYGYARKRPCPDCPAEAGEACVSSTGKPLGQVHISRRRIAIREYRAEQEARDD